MFHKVGLDTDPCRVPLLMPKVPLKQYRGNLLCLAESKHPDKNGEHATLQQPPKHDVKLGQVKCLGAVKHHNQRLAALPQVVLQHLLHQPGGLASAASPLETELELVAVQLVLPQTSRMQR